MIALQSERKTEALFPGREYYLDWIRNSIVLLLIPFHTAVSFSHIGKGYVYTSEPVDSWFYIFISDFFNLWIMRLLFFVSGYCVFYSRKKRTAMAYLRDRFKRLILPVLFLLLTLGPLSGYILAVSQYGFSGSFLAYYPRFFTEAKRYLFWGHMWYCVYLFIFSLMYLPLMSFLINRPVLRTKLTRFLAQKNHIYLPMAVIVLFEALLRPFYPGYQSFIGDWANVAVHSSFFLFGFIMAHSSELLESMTEKLGSFLISALVSTFLYLISKRIFFCDETYGQLVILSSLWGIAAYTWVLSIVILFRKYLNEDKPLLRYLSKTSFSLYLFHYLILTIFNFFLLRTGISHYLIWGLTTFGTYIVFIILFELVIKRSKVLSYIGGLGYKKKP